MFKLLDLVTARHINDPQVAHGIEEPEKNGEDLVDADDRCHAAADTN